MTLHRNRERLRTILKIRIRHSHRNRTINLGTRSDLNRTVILNGDRNIIPILILSGNLGVLILIGNLQTRILRILRRVHRLRSTRHSSLRLSSLSNRYGLGIGLRLIRGLCGYLNLGILHLLRDRSSECTRLVGILLRHEHGAIRKLDLDLRAFLRRDGDLLIVRCHGCNFRGSRLFDRLVRALDRLLRNGDFTVRSDGYCLVLHTVFHTGNAGDIGIALLHSCAGQLSLTNSLVKVNLGGVGLRISRHSTFWNESHGELCVIACNRNVVIVLVLEDFLRHGHLEISVVGTNLRHLRIRSAGLVAAGILRISLILQNFLTIRNTVTIGIELGGVGAELGLVGIEKAVAIGI